DPTGDYGDGNFDGEDGVEVGDLGLLATNWQANWTVLHLLGDLNGDGAVDEADQTIQESNPADLDGDGNINQDDLNKLIALKDFGVDLSSSIPHTP
ncbi:hypothetical protein OAS39_12595, partial [Pirellulales bacterium]|nr:hypothetical protein [Pirellulales bacterium]